MIKNIAKYSKVQNNRHEACPHIPIHDIVC